eukprot:GHVO01065478.1.p1 GENE.GHVO01065478.1~~GHVO01065478.1.p1  ORF type:complete len:420 (+),score=35.22 GHVO01065478.1:30-1289(+)
MQHDTRKNESNGDRPGYKISNASTATRCSDRRTSEHRTRSKRRSSDCDDSNHSRRRPLSPRETHRSRRGDDYDSQRPHERHRDAPSSNKRSLSSHDRRDNKYKKRTSRAKSRSRSSCSRTPTIEDARKRSREREKERRRRQSESIRASRQCTDRLFWDGFQWVTRSDASISGVFDQHMNATRKIRRLHVGNVPLSPEATEQTFRVFLTTELTLRSLLITPTPVVHVWFSKQDKGRFGFLEVATIEETASVIGMDGIMWMGHHLRITRPADVQRSMADPNNYMDLQKVIQSTSTTNIQAAPPLSDPAPLPPPLSPVNVLRFVCPSTCLDEEDYDDVLEDIVGGVQNCGKVISRMIIKPAHRNDIPFSLVGDVYVEFESREAVIKCIESMASRMYDGKNIKITEIDGTLWHNSLKMHALAS